MTENEIGITELIEQLIHLEYAIRTSITVREDQDEDADPHHVEAARRYRINPVNGMTKGDLLNAVQTLLRALQTENRNTKPRT